eukprot:13457763-Alexandrium_andersonii.AAC.1
MNSEAGPGHPLNREPGHPVGGGESGGGCVVLAPLVSLEAPLPAVATSSSATASWPATDPGSGACGGASAGQLQLVFGRGSSSSLGAVDTAA